MVVTENAHNVSYSQVSEIRIVATKKKKKLNVPQNTGSARTWLPTQVALLAFCPVYLDHQAGAMIGTHLLDGLSLKKAGEGAQEPNTHMDCHSPLCVLQPNS